MTLYALRAAMLSTLDSGGDMAAHHAAANGHVNVLRHQLLPYTLSARDSDGRTTAHAAAANGHVNVLRCLHELVPDTLSARDNDGRTAAHAAATNGHVNVLRCLHELVPDTLSAQDSDGEMPTHCAADQGHVDALRCLHALLPDTISAQDSEGRTAAHYAAAEGHRGVTLDDGRFQAQVYHEKKYTYLGHYDTAEEAAIAVATKYSNLHHMKSAEAVGAVEQKSTEADDHQNNEEQVDSEQNSSPGGAEEAEASPECTRPEGIVRCSQTYDTEGGMHGCVLPAFHAGEHSIHTTLSAASLREPRRGSINRLRAEPAAVTTLSCDFCGRGLANAGAKVNHQKACRMRHHNNAPESVSPDAKQAKIEQNALTKAHKQPFSCDFCGRGLVNMGSKVNHQRSCSMNHAGHSKAAASEHQSCHGSPKASKKEVETDIEAELGICAFSSAEEAETATTLAARSFSGVENAAKEVAKVMDKSGCTTHKQAMEVAEFKSNKSQSGFRGVTATPSGRFQAQLRVGGLRESVGTFDTAEEAAAALAKRQSVLGECDVGKGSAKKPPQINADAAIVNTSPPVQKLKHRTTAEEIANDILASSFYSAEEAQNLQLGTQLMVADTNGVWFPSQVVAQRAGSVCVEWVDPASVGASEDEYWYGHDDIYALSKCATPELAFQASQDLEKIRIEISAGHGRHAVPIRVPASKKGPTSGGGDNVPNQKRARGGGGGDEGCIDLSAWRSKRSCTGYLGVRLTTTGKFLASLTLRNVGHSLGTYDTIEEAVAAVASRYMKVYGETPADRAAKKRPHSSENWLNPEVVEMDVKQPQLKMKPRARNSSIHFPAKNESEIDLSMWRSNRSNTGYFGVTKTKRGTFTASVTVDGVSKTIGSYPTDDQAAVAVARKYLGMHGATPGGKTTKNRIQAAPTAATNKIDLSPWISYRNSSGFKGVTKRGPDTFEAHASVGDAYCYLGRYNTAEEAATVVARNELQKSLSGVHKRPGFHSTGKDTAVAKKRTTREGEPHRIMQAPSARAAHGNTTSSSRIDLSFWRSTASSGYKGVYCRGNENFEAQVREGSAQVVLGSYKTAEKAAIAVAKRHINQNGGVAPVYHPTASSKKQKTSELAPPNDPNTLLSWCRSDRNESGYRGVTLTSQGKFLARIGSSSNRQNLGTFNTAEGAARAFRQAFLKLQDGSADGAAPSTGVPQPRPRASPAMNAFESCTHLQDKTATFKPKNQATGFQEVGNLPCAVCLEANSEKGLKYPCDCKFGYHTECFQSLLESDPKWRKECPSCRHTFVRLPLQLRILINNVSLGTPTTSNVKSPDTSARDSSIRAKKRDTTKSALEYQKRDDTNRVSIWDSNKRRRICGTAAPSTAKLAEYLETYPDREVYSGQDVEDSDMKDGELAATTSSSGIDLSFWRSTASSGYKGVYRRSDEKFEAQIREDGVQVKLGTYKTAKEAATAVAKRHIEQNGGVAPLMLTDVEVGSEHALRDALSSVNLQAYAHTFIDQEV